MTGYNGFSMSNNAVFAYNDGKKPLTKFKKKDFTENELNLSKSFYLWLAEIGYWTASEWHHTSKHYNKTEFYCLQDLKQNIFDDLDCDEFFLKKKLSEWKKEKKENDSLNKENTEVVKVFFSYYDWGGTRKYPKRFIVENVRGELQGNWIYYNNGFNKKNINGNNFISYEIVKSFRGHHLRKEVMKNG